MGNLSLRNLVIFSYRIPVFLDFVIEHLSQAQLGLAAALREIDVATTEKRDLNTVLKTIEGISEAIAGILRVKACFLRQRLPACRDLIRRRPAAILAEMETVDWFSYFSPSGDFNLFLGGDYPDDPSELEAAGSDLLDLGGKMPVIDLHVLEVLGIILAVGFAAEAAATMGRSFTALASVSIGADEEQERIVHQIVRLTREIREHLAEIGVIFQALGCFWGEDGSSGEGS